MTRMKAKMIYAKKQTCVNCDKVEEVWFIVDDMEQIKNYQCENCYDKGHTEFWNGYADSYYSGGRYNTNCRCGGAGACIQCNPSMFL